MMRVFFAMVWPAKTPKPSTVERRRATCGRRDARGTSRSYRIRLTQLARTVPVLEHAAAACAFEVIPLLGVSFADAADLALPVLQLLFARRAHERGRHLGRTLSVSELVDVAHGPAPVDLGPFDQAKRLCALFIRALAKIASPFAQLA